MSLQIDLVADDVLPESGLPHVVSAGVACAANSVRKSSIWCVSQCVWRLRRVNVKKYVPPGWRVLR